MTGDAFDWQTEEPAGDPQEDDASRSDRLPRRRRLLALLLLGLLAVAAGLLILQRAQRRVAATQDRLAADVRSAYQLGLEAARDRDAELLRSILSPTDDAWAAAQQALLDQSRLFGGAPQALTLLPLSQEPQAVDVVLDPDLQAATVSGRWTYAAPLPGDSATQTVAFTHTHLFRLQDGRWWLSPPAGDKWHERRTLSGERVTLDAPARDEALAGRLAADLDDLLAEMCRAVVRCPDDFHIRVHLAIGPLSLATLDPIESMVTLGDDDLTLPTPSLVGLPAGDGAYDALFRGYARFVVAAAVADLVDYDCCDHVLFYRALLARQLAHLRLRSMPSPPVGYALIDEGASLDAVQQHWLVDRPDRPTPPAVHAFLAFLVGTWVDTAGGVPAEAALMRAFNEPVNVNFWAWIADLPWDGEAVDDSVTGGWRRYLMGRLSEQAGREGEPPLNFDLIAACGTAALGVFRYRVADAEWSIETGVPATGGASLNHAHLMRLPDGDFIIRPFIPQDSFNTWLVREDGQEFSNERVISLSEAGNPLVEVIPFARAPDGRLAAYLDDKAGDAGALQFALFDPQQCDGGCPVQRIPGHPVWSPDGSRIVTLQQRPDVDRLLLRREGGDGDAGWDLLAEAPIGHSFWLNETTVGYLRQQALYGYQELILQTVDTGEQRPLLSAATLLAVLGQDFPTFELVWVTRHPLTADSLLIMATAFQEGLAILFAVQRPPGGSWMEGEPRIRILGDIAATPQMASPVELRASPDGRWLSFVVPWANTEGRETGDRFWLFDLQEEQTVLNVAAYIPQDRYFASSLGLYAWSPDGVWLARLIEGGVDLFAPESGTRRPIFHDFGRCTSVTWVPRQ